MSKSNSICNVESCFLCRACVPEWRKVIVGSKVTIQYKKGEPIFKAGEPVKGIGFVYKGKVKVHKHWGDKELIIRFAVDGSVIGHRSIGSQDIYPVSATALETTLVCFISTDFLLSSLKINPDLTFRLMMLYADELQFAEHRMRNLVHMDMKGRLADALLMIQKEFGIDGKGNLNLTVSRQDLASFAGTSYESMFRILNELVSDKIIQLEDKNIRIINEAKLTSFTQETT